MTAHKDWTGRTLAMIGGDRREQEIAQAAAATGATVRAFGFPWPDGGIAGVERSASARDAARGASILLLPLPAMTADRVFAPAADAPVIVDRAVLSAMASGGLVVAGAASPGFRELLAELSLGFAGYEHDEAGRIARAPAIAEGAIARIVQETDFTIGGASIVQLGYGIVGAQLARSLRALGATVHVVARNPVQLAAARAAGHCPAPPGSSASLVEAADLLINTAPAILVDEAMLKAVSPRCVIIDLASPPGGIDRVAAEKLGRRVVWARGLGATSPVTVGRAQWSIISELIERHFAGAAAISG